MWMVAPIHCRKLHFKKRKKIMKMNFKQNSVKLAIAAGLVIGSAGLNVPAFAEEPAEPAVTGTMDVSARIGVACSVTTVDITFGEYDAVVAHKDTDLRSVTGKIKQTCTIGSMGTIDIDAGENAGSDVTKRAMKTAVAISGDETNLLNYSVHVVDDILTDNWPASNGKPYTATGVEQENIVYAFVPQNQNKAVKGAYADELTITITY
jgi:spore coat protein U-like protein